MSLLNLFKRNHSRDKLIPPKKLQFVGGGDFEVVGEHLFNVLKQTTGLQPHHHVLDIGCGSGRVARQLTDFLESDAQYRGFDVVKAATDWCQKYISSKFPNFQFEHADIYNSHYNPAGKVQSNAYPFPYKDSVFDIVFLTSVFTHMKKEEVKHYLTEIKRVMKDDGKCMCTFFLINEESEKSISEGKADQKFSFQQDEVSMVVEQDNPDTSIAFKEKYILKIIEEAGFTLCQPIDYGFWIPERKGTSYQDILVIQKTKHK